MMLFKKAHDQSKGISSTTPIAKELQQISEIDMKVKFVIAHFIATQRLAFTHYPALCQLEEFMLEQLIAFKKLVKHFVAEITRIAKAQYFSILMDDSANIDDEIFLILWCDVDCEDQLIHTNMSYFCISRLMQKVFTIVLRALFVELEYRLLVVTIAKW